MYLSLILMFLIPSLVTADKDAVFCQKTPIEIVILIDSSSSVEKENFEKIKTFMGDFLREFDIGNRTRVAFTSYADGVYMGDTCQLDTYKTRAQILAAVSKIHYHAGASTGTWTALRYMRETQLAKNKVRKGAKRIGIVITDGKSQKWKITAKEAKLSRDAGITMFAIGIGHANQPELDAIGGSRAQTIKVNNADGLKRIIQIVLAKTCTSTPSVCYKNIDMSLLLDSSSSIGNADFKKIKTFVSNFIQQQFNFGQGGTRVAICTFGSKVNKKDCIGFNKYTKKVDLVKAIDGLKRAPTGVTTETGEALLYMRTVQMASARANSRKICIVITDGVSQRWSLTWGAAKDARKANIITFAVGIGNDVKEVELNRIAGDKSREFRVENAGSLKYIKAALANLICH